MTALSRVENLVASAKEASALALAVLATDHCRSCHGRGSALVDVCSVCFDKPREGQMDGLVLAEMAASQAASARLMDLVVADTGASASFVTALVEERAAGGMDAELAAAEFAGMVVSSP